MSEEKYGDQKTTTCEGACGKRRMCMLMMIQSNKLWICRDCRKNIT